MRPGHNSSGSSEEGCESTIDVQPSLMTVEQSQLVDQHRSEGETLGVDQPSCGHLSVHLEDGLEMLIEVLVGHAAQLVEDAPDFDAIVGVRVTSSFSGNQEPLLGASEACLSDVGRVVVDVSEYEAHLVRQLLDEVGSYQVVCCVGGSEHSRQRNPNLTHGDGQMQLPPVHPPMPAALSPVSFGVYGCMGHLACFLVFVVPHSTFCLQNGAVEGYSSSPALPRLEHFYQVASQRADLLRQALGQSLKTPLEGAPGGETSLFREGIAHHAHLRSGLVEDRQELSHPTGSLLTKDDVRVPMAARRRYRHDQTLARRSRSRPTRSLRCSP